MLFVVSTSPLRLLRPAVCAGNAALCAHFHAAPGTIAGAELVGASFRYRGSSVFAPYGEVA
jgi:hypothetical protein